ncbi:MAG: hypothetical protein Q7T19_09720 [Caulobacter sp.]|nr:hypothetical protein [Caulobacter sp.]
MTARFKQVAVALLILAGALLTPSTASATGNFCSVSGATQVSVGNYNPFVGGGLNQVPVTLELQRYFASSSKRTQKVNFYLVRASSGMTGLEVSYQGASVLYTPPAAPVLSTSNPRSGTVDYNFGNAKQPNTVQISLVVTLPPGLDLPAGEPIVFDMVYVCTGVGGLNSVSTPTTLADAVTLNVNVLSALQASYAGPPLNFGEIGAISDAEAPTHVVEGDIRVASSGPYTVSMTAANGYRMTYPGGNPAVAAQRIGYSIGFLGQTLSNADPSMALVICKRAGVGGELLPITATLQDGGGGKAPSPVYKDVLTVTITPAVYWYELSGVDCSGL